MEYLLQSCSGSEPSLKYVYTVLKLNPHIHWKWKETCTFLCVSHKDILIKVNHSYNLSSFQYLPDFISPISSHNFLKLILFSCSGDPPPPYLPHFPFVFVVYISIIMIIVQLTSYNYMSAIDSSSEWSIKQQISKCLPSKLFFTWPSMHQFSSSVACQKVICKPNSNIINKTSFDIVAFIGLILLTK